ncbi:MAG: hypothetical protein AAF950_06475 [Pseudomonadota bacterium]
MKYLLAAGVSGLVLAACGGAETTSSAAAPETATQVADTAPEAVVDPIETVLAGAWRSDENKARDASRHPKETLEFFEVSGDETLIEIYPGGGWYTEVLAPLINAGGGTYIAANFGNAERDAQFLERFADETVFGPITVTALTPESEAMVEGNSVDTVLSFRNVHNWMGRGYEKKVLEDVYTALKPGGVFGLVEHRLPSSADQDPRAGSGYVHEDYMINLAKEVGFELGGTSEINANPKDTADHPFGVWTLPPVSATTDRDGNAPEDFDAQKYLDIGESDRFTLKFVKPLETASASEGDGS